MLKKSAFFRWSLLLNAVLLAFIFVTMIVYRDKWVYRLVEWKGHARIVFFGDSMTAQGRWMELLGRTDLQNSAIPSLTTHHLKDFVPNGVLNYRPEYCFVMAGINDINMGVCQDKLRSNYQIILEKFLLHNIKPVVQLTLYEVNDPESNAQVDSLNHFLIGYCRQNGLDYIDVNQFLSDGVGLKTEYARDETHLNAKGYRIWGDEIRRFMKEKGI